MPGMLRPMLKVLLPHNGVCERLGIPDAIFGS
jgi:hypothetical protein